MNKKNELLLSVIVPTRARIETLRACLRTCAAQDFDRCEFVVSDNVSNDGTEALVREFIRSDPRFKYFNTGKRLGMSENYEYGLSQSRGQYVGYIGDDDGLIPGGLKRVAETIASEHPGAIISSCRPRFIWPGAKDSEGHLFMPPRLGKGRIHKYCGKDELIRFAGFGKCNYLELPSIYYGFCSRKAIEAARGTNGRFFNSHTPDVYSAVAVAAVTDYISVPYAFAMAGLSRHSIGMNLHENLTPKDDAAASFHVENKIASHPAVPQSLSIPLVICETLFQLRDNVLCRLNGFPDFKINVAAYLNAAMRFASIHGSSFYDRARKDVMETGKRNGREDSALMAIERYPHIGYLPNDMTPCTLLFSHRSVDGNRILDIDAAVKAYEALDRRISFFPSFYGAMSFLGNAIMHPLYWLTFIRHRLAQRALNRA